MLTKHILQDGLDTLCNNEQYGCEEKGTLVFLWHSEIRHVWPSQRTCFIEAML